MRERLEVEAEEACAAHFAEEASSALLAHFGHVRDGTQSPNALLVTRALSPRMPHMGEVKHEAQSQADTAAARELGEGISQGERERQED